ncbi:hypothetical protein PoB_005110000 [Plakobranchus ocellatus]|uniref:Uncharacterized protein n=1 Tax=Plakobranchus ocellatus TaxID=259542 RepID=A0AAV4BVW2_9GAST|nr:hypothetical protein PoB_005110000 [Plakobranchus ocellatus]
MRLTDAAGESGKSPLQLPQPGTSEQTVGASTHLGYSPDVTRAWHYKRKAWSSSTHVSTRASRCQAGSQSPDNSFCVQV